MKPGLFVSFEGIEGCGKTTQIKLLSQMFDARGIAHALTREPGGTGVGDGIRRILLDSETIGLTSEAELLLFYASRSQNLAEKIRPARQRGEVVLCDRFYDASVAYQGYGRGIPLDFIHGLTALVCAGDRPDMTILFDIEPSVGLGRARDRNQKLSEDEGRFEAEDLDFYGRVRSGYLELARDDPQRFRVIEANGSIEEIHREVCDLIGVADGVA
jgi:dTMP kinase